MRAFFACTANTVSAIMCATECAPSITITAVLMPLDAPMSIPPDASWAMSRPNLVAVVTVLKIDCSSCCALR